MFMVFSRCSRTKEVVSAFDVIFAYDISRQFHDRLDAIATVRYKNNPFPTSTTLNDSANTIDSLVHIYTYNDDVS